MISPDYGVPQLEMGNSFVKEIPQVELEKKRARAQEHIQSRPDLYFTDARCKAELWPTDDGDGIRIYSHMLYDRAGHSADYLPFLQDETDPAIVARNTYEIFDKKDGTTLLHIDQGRENYYEGYMRDHLNSQAGELSLVIEKTKSTDGTDMPSYTISFSSKTGSLSAGQNEKPADRLLNLIRPARNKSEMLQKIVLSVPTLSEEDRQTLSIALKNPNMIKPGNTFQSTFASALENLSIQLLNQRFRTISSF